MWLLRQKEKDCDGVIARGCYERWRGLYRMRSDINNWFYLIRWHIDLIITLGLEFDFFDFNVCNFTITTHSL